MKKDRPVQRPLKDNKAAAPAEKAAPKAPPMAPKKYINVYLSIGSNMGDRLEYVRAASMAVHKTIGKIARKSRLYETQAWGKTDQERRFSLNSRISAFPYKLSSDTRSDRESSTR
ncbi:MAG: 2-amino-4-hydroxy-6-hydroxymethyldihydropteridine diphosphokinase [Bacteroidota bacterium]